METITSPKNPKVLAWRALQTRKGREEQNSFLVEGVRMVREALDSDFDLRALLLREGVEPAFALPAGVPVFLLSDRVFAAVSETKTPQGVAAVLSRRIRPLSGSRFVALDAVQDPGNVGTIIRTADAAGFDGVLLGPECADLFSSKVLRSTMGSIFRLSFAFPEDLSAVGAGEGFVEHIEAEKGGMVPEFLGHVLPHIAEIGLKRNTVIFPVLPEGVESSVYRLAPEISLAANAVNKPFFGELL